MERDIVKKTFAEVGLYPWNPDHILKIFEEHCVSLSVLEQGPLVRKLLNIIKSVRQENQGMVNQMVCGMKRASVEIVQKGKPKSGLGEEKVDQDEDDEQKE